MDELQLKELLKRYGQGLCTDEEKALVETWYLKDDASFTSELTGQTINDDLGVIFGQLPQPKTRALWPRIAVAASILLFLSFGGYFLIKKRPVQQTAAVVKHDVDPGGHRAILTLSNGKQVVLNSQQGKIAQQGTTAILLNANGTVNYTASTNGSQTAETAYNTLTVPIGNRRDMTLADGTEVSLDAGSSITYPVVFNTEERTVTITGQVYFAVKHDADHPFNVRVKDLIIHDIGTEFNVNAYDDEGAVKTTLIEGIVKVNNTTLKPGQQALADNGHIELKKADVEAVTAWRNDNFLFRNQDLKATMRQLARWYNVNVVYDHAPENIRVLADISRQRKLSVILAAIEQTSKVKFKIENKTVTVSQ